jgi:hypothetical protein
MVRYPPIYCCIQSSTIYRTNSHCKHQSPGMVRVWCRHGLRSCQESSLGTYIYIYIYNIYMYVCTSCTYMHTSPTSYMYILYVCRYLIFRPQMRRLIIIPTCGIRILHDGHMLRHTDILHTCSTHRYWSVMLHKYCTFLPFLLAYLQGPHDRSYRQCTIYYYVRTIHTVPTIRTIRTVQTDRQYRHKQK